MLEFYRKHYMTNNNRINYLDIIIAIVLTKMIWDWSISFALKAPILFLLWLRAVMTVACMLQNSQKKIGIGTASFLLVVLALFWSVELKNGICIGDTVLKKISLPSWTNGSTGFHLTLLYCLIFLIPALILSLKYPDHLFAKTSKAISWIGLLMILSLSTIIVFT
ncbi:MAG TPA: hypothetical protein VM577_00345 [Anaerovoracaceae bacterium]|nr:hypothetical protein [Anaerovoracaceae bacterium]